MTKKTKTFGALKKRFTSKDGTRTIVVIGRHDDTQATTKSGETITVAVWQVTSETTGRTTKLRDDSLAKDYVLAKESKPKPKSAPKSKPVKSAEVPITKVIAPVVKPQLVNHVGFKAALVKQFGGIENIEITAGTIHYELERLCELGMPTIRKTGMVFYELDGYVCDREGNKSMFSAFKTNLSALPTQADTATDP